MVKLSTHWFCGVLRVVMNCLQIGYLNSCVGLRISICANSNLRKSVLVLSTKDTILRQPFLLFLVGKLCQVSSKLHKVLDREIQVMTSNVLRKYK